MHTKQNPNAVRTAAEQKKDGNAATRHGRDDGLEIARAEQPWKSMNKSGQVTVPQDLPMKLSSRKNRQRAKTEKGPTENRHRAQRA
jgi:hypothetical protein